MLPHCLEQSDEALAYLHCFGMVRSKCLLIHRHCTGIPGAGLLAVALSIPKQRKIMHDLRRFWMLSSQSVFTDVECMLVERLRLRILTLLTVEARQVAE